MRRSPGSLGRRSRDLARHAVLPLQSGELGNRQVAPLSRTETFVGDPGEREPRQTEHREPGCLAEAMDLTILPLAEHDAELGRAPCHREPRHLGRPRRAPADVYALPEAGEIAIFHDAFDLGDVDLR